MIRSSRPGMTRGIRRTVVIVAAIALMLGGCSGGGGENGASLSSDDEITVALGGDPLTLNPFDWRAGVNFYGFSQVYERLLTRDADGEIAPGLASEWEVSDDGLTYTFTLRDDVVFHNGDPMTSADVKFSLERFADPDIQVFSYMLSDMEAVETPDEHTAIVKFSKPNAQFLTGLGLAFIVPESIGDEPDDHLDATGLGTGPFTLASRSVGEGFRLERFDDYWGDRAGFAAIDVRVISDSNARVSALRSGQVDYIVPVPPQNVDQLKADFTVKSANDSNTVGIAFDNQSPGEEGILADERVRRAMDLAIDREGVVKTALNGFGIAHGGVAPQNPGNDRVPMVEQDLDQAKKLIDEAGVAGESVTLYVPQNGRVTSSEQVGQTVAAFWDQIGLKTDLRIIAYEEWIDRQKNGPGQAMLSFMGDEFTGSPITRLENFQGCEGSSSNFCDEELEKIIQRASVSPSLEAHVDDYVEGFTLMQERGLGIQMYVQETAYAMKPSICWEPVAGTSIPRLATLEPCD